MAIVIRVQKLTEVDRIDGKWLLEP
jgi:hypothetical protein